MNNALEARFARAHDRLTAHPRVALVVIPSPEYDVPVFNLCSAELAGYLRHRNPELIKSGIELLEPDILFSRSDALQDSPHWIVEQLNRSRPHIIGLSAKIGSTANLRTVLELLAGQAWARASVVIVGNVVSTFSHDQLVEALPDALYAMGDGEITLDVVYRMVASGQVDLSSIPNIAYQSHGSLTFTRKELLDHPNQHWLPAFDNLELAESKRGDIVIRATTGCSAHCTFCSIRELNLFTDSKGATRKGGWRSYPPERTAAQLQFLEQRGISRVNFADDEFGNVDFNFLDRLADLLIAQNNTVRFNVSMRLDAFWTPTMAPQEHKRRQAVLVKLLRAGLDSIFAGAESGSASQLKRYGKGYPVEVNVRSLDMLLNHNVKVHVGFIPFDQFVNRYEVEDNLDFLESEVGGSPLYRFVTSPINVMRVQRGTPYEGLMRRAGLLGELESNLSFYASRFVDARMEKIALLARDWYSEIQDTRYPLSQLRRYATDNLQFESAMTGRVQDLLDEMHRLDIAFVRALLEVFPEDHFDALFKGGAAFLQKHPEVPQAVARWAQEAAHQEASLDRVARHFRGLRLPLEAAMKALLKEIYGREKSELVSPLEVVENVRDTRGQVLELRDLVKKPVERVAGFSSGAPVYEPKEQEQFGIFDPLQQAS